jgi:hypothetical protein
MDKNFLDRKLNRALVVLDVCCAVFFTLDTFSRHLQQNSLHSANIVVTCCDCPSAAAAAGPRSGDLLFLINFFNKLSLKLVFFHIKFIGIRVLSFSSPLRRRRRREVELSSLWRLR